MAKVRCVWCNKSDEVKDENSWYETHQCPEGTVRSYPKRKKAA